LTAAALGLFVEKGFAATKARRSRRARGRVQGHAVPLLPQQGRSAQGGHPRPPVQRDRGRCRRGRGPRRLQRRAARRGAAQLVAAGLPLAGLRRVQAG